jgi:hypothetical protein
MKTVMLPCKDKCTSIKKKMDGKFWNDIAGRATEEICPFLPRESYFCVRANKILGGQLLLVFHFNP